VRFAGLIALAVFILRPQAEAQISASFIIVYEMLKNQLIF
jgi:hypothetical protein